MMPIEMSLCLLMLESVIINVNARSHVYAKYCKVFRESPLLIVAGEVQRQGGMINLAAEEAVPLAA
ncbi:MAG: hypothetical protein ABI700_18365 [Chloroflexota bacterium]